MKIMVDGKTYDSLDTPILILLEDFNKKDISEMADNEKLYFEVPQNFTDDQVKAFLKRNYDSNWGKVRVVE
jgi:hypothetical protein